MKWVVVVVLLALPALACVVPGDGVVFGSSAILCPDVFHLRSPLVVSGRNIVLDCNGAVLTGLNGDVGVRIERSENVTLANCSIVGHRVGVVVRESSHILLIDNNLVRNRVGVSFTQVYDSSAYNRDVSLNSPFDIAKSERNALSLSNKPVRGDFCRKNFCDVSREGALLHVQPRMSKAKMGLWLSDQVTGRSVENKFRNWVFGSLF